MIPLRTEPQPDENGDWFIEAGVALFHNPKGKPPGCGGWMGFTLDDLEQLVAGSLLPAPCPHCGVEMVTVQFFEIARLLARLQAAEG